MISSIVPVIHNARGGGGTTYERGRDARRKFWIEPLIVKETYLGVAQAFLSPKRDHVIGYIFIFFRVQP